MSSNINSTSDNFATLINIGAYFAISVLPYSINNSVSYKNDSKNDSVSHKLVAAQAGITLLSGNIVLYLGSVTSNSYIPDPRMLLSEMITATAIAILLGGKVLSKFGNENEKKEPYKRATVYTITAIYAIFITTMANACLREIAKVSNRR